jgi:hypothetical protein
MSILHSRLNDALQAIETRQYLLATKEATPTHEAEAVEIMALLEAFDTLQGEILEKFASL